MLEDLTMLATLPVDQSAVRKAEDEADKDRAAAGAPLPPPKDPPANPDDTPESRIARGGQNPPEHEEKS